MGRTNPEEFREELLGP